MSKALTKAEIKGILSGDEVLLNGCIKKAQDGNEKKYDMYVKMTGNEAFVFKKKDGSEGMGFSLKYDTRFPDKNNSDGSNGTPVEIGEESLDFGNAEEDLPFN